MVRAISRNSEGPGRTLGAPGPSAARGELHARERCLLAGQPYPTITDARFIEKEPRRLSAGALSRGRSEVTMILSRQGTLFPPRRKRMKSGLRRFAGWMIARGSRVRLNRPETTLSGGVSPLLNPHSTARIWLPVRVGDERHCHLDDFLAHGGPIDDARLRLNGPIFGHAHRGIQKGEIRYRFRHRHAVVEFAIRR